MMAVKLVVSGMSLGERGKTMRSEISRMGMSFGFASCSRSLLQRQCGDPL